jgi:16S rRNA (uracil1498-N3)-methyltransferase
MDLPIFYHQEINADFITLTEDASRHVVQVLRMQHGENLQLTDGAGYLGTAEIVDPHKKKTTVRITSRTYAAQNQNRISIGISLLKNSSRFEWFLEKATEIGVAEIHPLLAERTEKQQFKFERMKQITVSAMLQSQQTWLPGLHEPTPVEKVLKASNYSTRLIAHCNREMRKPITVFARQKSVQILIGPEGDFTEREIGLALNHNFEAVTLGENRLRTETAGVVAAAILSI